MIKTIVFNGGLGNQMFQYAFYLQLKEKNPFFLSLFDIEQAQGCHNGFELDRIFNVNSKKKIFNYRLINRFFPFILKHSKTIKQENSLKYNNDIINTSCLLMRYEGFWQSSKYFDSIALCIKKAFSFREDIINEKTTSITDYLIHSNSVSVHIRRGDYLLESETRGLCSMEYYKKAMSIIRERVNNPSFIFFSDDVDWVKENFKQENAKYITWNHKEDSWQDMYLMSRCKHNIIANSSFSWWGAWLNSNTNKIVIAPTPWFKNSLDYDIIPSSWIKVQR